VIVAPPPAVTLTTPFTLTMVVRAAPAPSASVTLTPAMARAVSSLVLCAPGTVLTGASLILRDVDHWCRCLHSDVVPARAGSQRRVLPPSLVTMSGVTGPLALATGT
jgi:hypothetical protein